MTDRDLLRRIERAPGQRAGYKQLVRELGLGGGRERRLLLEQLARLTARGLLTKTDSEQWALASAKKQDAPVIGRLDLNREGYGFVRPLTPGSGLQQDVFIPADAIEGAMQGDIVQIALLPARSDGRRAGRITRIVERRAPTFVGIFHAGRAARHPSRTERADTSRWPANFVTPIGERNAQPILIPAGMEIPQAHDTASPHRVLGAEAQTVAVHAAAAAAQGALDGLVVHVEITDWPTPTRPARGRVLEVLGDREAFGVDVEILIRKHHLPHVFPDAVLEQATRVAVPPASNPALSAGRRDFRALPIVTIDGETARDFDDAVYARPLSSDEGGGYELHVHIADVAAYVQPGTALDQEAHLRGNSVYFPDRAIPMLPAALSTDVCSLRPNEDRLVLSCILQIAPDGAVLSAEVCEGLIRSARRMTYTQVHAILDGDAATRAEFADLVPEFERLYALARLLNTQRERRGSIDFDLPEPVIQFDEQGRMRGIARSERTWANRLIEECMLAANEAVAAWIAQTGAPSLYRIHEKPEPKRIVNFEEIAAGFGYSLGLGALPVRKLETRGDRRDRVRRGGNERRHTVEIPEEIPVTPQMYQRLVERLAGKPEERILTYLMLRSLRQARYSEENLGHFALATPCYTHFTSPIRRYPDLIVHRIIKALLQAGVSGHIAFPSPNTTPSPWAQRSTRLQPAPAWQRADSALPAPIDAEALAAIAQHCSETERTAAEAERELIEWKKVRFMRDRVGEEFAAIVLSATRYGLFVELDDLFVEGLVPIDTLRNDHYTYRENTRQIQGERTGHSYAAGARVQVILDRIDVFENKLQFSIVEESILPKGGSGNRFQKKPKTAVAQKHRKREKKRKQH